MLMSVVRSLPGNTVYPELAGIRILVTGLDAATGVDLARAFADHKARLVLQTADMSPEVEVLGAVLAESAAEIKLYDQPLADNAAAKTFAQGPAQALGGLDAVVNFINFTRADLAACADLAEIEAMLAKKLGPALFITQVTANRMRLTLGEGMVLNVVRLPEARNAVEKMLAGYVRAAVATLTRVEAEKWAGEAVRINAVAPRTELADEQPGGHCITSEPDVAALALYLASKKGRKLSGHVFDATGVASRGC